MTFMHTKVDYEKAPEVDAWMKEETAEQEVRYAKIDGEMDALKEKRAVWYEEFFHRIETKGFNTDGDMRTKIKPEDIPVKPEGRKDQVIWKYGEISTEEIEGK
jgi:hypothetical protein